VREPFDRRRGLTEGASAFALDEAMKTMLAGERIIEVHRAPEPLASSYYTTQRLWELEQGFVKIAGGRTPGRPRSTTGPSPPCWSATNT